MIISKREIAQSTVVFVTIIALTVLVIVFYPRTYRSTAKLLLKIGRESVTLDPTVASAGATLSLHRTRESEINTTLDMMRSRLVLQSVAERIGNDTILSGMPPEKAEEKTESSPGLLSGLRSLVQLDSISEDELVLLELESKLSIESEGDSGVVKVQYKAKSPEVAQLIVQTWTDAYRQMHVGMSSTVGGSKFFESEESAMRTRLVEARTKLREAKDRAGLVTVSGQQTMLENQLFASRQAVATSEALLAASESRMETLSKWSERIPDRILVSEGTVGNRAHEQMRSDLYQLEIEEKRLNALYSDTHPKLIQVRQQRKEAAEILAAQGQTTVESTQDMNPVSQDLQGKMIDAQAEQVAMQVKLQIEKTQLAALEKALVELNQLEQEILQLESEVEFLAGQHLAILEKHEQAKLADSLEENEITSINVVQPATFEARPATPNKKLCALLGIFAAFCGATGVTLMSRTVERINEAPAPLRVAHRRRTSNYPREFAVEHESLRHEEAAGMHPR
jgi:uncharacterized protein involved in exopolysaccharide biosynthesis